MPKDNLDGKTPQPSPSRLRCAIYTRKSTEEGLDQDFNSLDAQREAAEAFILSQRREGWIASPQLYDDGGFSEKSELSTWVSKERLGGGGEAGDVSQSKGTQMNEKLKRRIEKLERQGGVGFETELRAMVSRFGGNEEVYLQALRGHERELRQALGEGGGITWEGFLVLVPSDATFGPRLIRRSRLWTCGFQITVGAREHGLLDWRLG